MSESNQQFDGIYETPQGDFVADSVTGRYYKVTPVVQHKTVSTRVSKQEFLTAVKDCPAWYLAYMGLDELINTNFGVSL